MTGWRSATYWVVLVVTVVAAVVVRRAVGGTGGWVAAAGVLAAFAVVVGVLAVLAEMPAGERRELEDRADSEVVLPEGLVPAELALVDRWRSSSPSSPQELLAEDFVATPLGAEAPISRREYLLGRRLARLLYREYGVTFEEVLVDPEMPTVAWVRVTWVARPRIGRRIRATWWDVWTMTDDLEQLRALRTAAVVSAS